MQPRLGNEDEHIDLYKISGSFDVNRVNTDQDTANQKTIFKKLKN